MATQKRQSTYILSFIWTPLTETAWNGRDRLVGYSAYTDEARTTCGLTINNVSEQDLGNILSESYAKKVHMSSNSYH